MKRAAAAEAKANAKKAETEEAPEVVLDTGSVGVTERPRSAMLTLFTPNAAEFAFTTIRAASAKLFCKPELAPASTEFLTSVFTRFAFAGGTMDLTEVVTLSLSE